MGVRLVSETAIPRKSTRRDPWRAEVAWAALATALARRRGWIRDVGAGPG